MSKDLIKNAKDKIKEISKIKLNGSITIRIDNDTKERFEKVCHDMGLSISSAISAFVTKVANTNSIPFPITSIKNKRNIGMLDGKYDFSEEEFNKLDSYVADIFGV